MLIVDAFLCVKLDVVVGLYVRRLLLMVQEKVPSLYPSMANSQPYLHTRSLSLWVTVTFTSFICHLSWPVCSG